MAQKKDAKTKTAEKPKDAAPKAAPPASAQAVAPAENPEAPRGVRLRLGYPKVALELYGVDARMWQVLIDAVWPSARTPEAVMLALAYCKGRHLDPMKKMVHIVPVWSKDAPSDEPGKSGGFIETVWPSIAEIRITATRTGVYAGKDAAEFGPIIKRTFKGEKDVWENNRKTRQAYEKEISYPEWCRVTVYKIVQGVRCAFVGPMVYWEEAYATESRWSEMPNEMWADRRSGQLEKCAEAASLRSAFPEELGGEYAAEEMYGRSIEHAPARPVPALPPGQAAPPASDGKSEFARPATATLATPAAKVEPEKKDAPKPEEKKPTPAAQGSGDPRPEPPLEGVVEEPVQQAAAEPAEEEKPSQELLTMLDEAIKKLDACTKVGQVADLREEVEQEIPPAFEKLTTEWNANCDVKQQAIIDARPKK